MNILPAHLETLEAFGYTPAEARFLYLVATHSGYFVARQFLAVTGAHWGKRTTLFWNRLKNNRHARTECFPQGGVVYHLFSRRLYRHIGKENLRNRRAHELDFIQRRISILDFIIQNQAYEYLETEPDKLRFFCETMNVAKQCLPARLYLGRKTSRTSLRYFVDKFPMFLASPPPVVTFTYIQQGGAALVDFVRHLEAYLPLFRELPEFHLMYVSRSDATFAKAGDIFSSLVKMPLESNIAADLLRYFRVRKAWDEKRYGSVGDAELIFRNHARMRFGGERFEGLYRGWKNGRLSDDGIAQEVGTDGRKRKVVFETFLLNRGCVAEGQGVATG